jgi:hypothetical protein
LKPVLTVTNNLECSTSTERCHKRPWAIYIPAATGLELEWEWKYGFDIATARKENWNWGHKWRYIGQSEFHASEEVTNILNNKSFSALHLNIRILSANFDPLCNLLFDLHHSFSIIGLSETKIKYHELFQVDIQ